MAPGSHKTYANPRWEPKVCDRCGGKLTLSGPSCLWGYNLKTGPFAYHLGKCPK